MAELLVVAGTTPLRVAQRQRDRRPRARDVTETAIELMTPAAVLPLPRSQLGTQPGEQRPRLVEATQHRQRLRPVPSETRGCAALVRPARPARRGARRPGSCRESVRRRSRRRVVPSGNPRAERGRRHVRMPQPSASICPRQSRTSTERPVGTDGARNHRPPPRTPATPAQRGRRVDSTAPSGSTYSTLDRLLEPRAELAEPIARGGRRRSATEPARRTASRGLASPGEGGDDAEFERNVDLSPEVGARSRARAGSGRRR